MKIACIGYRSWAIDIYKNIQKDFPDYEYINQTSKQSYDEAEIIQFKPDLILFYGWSWIISDEVIDNFTCLLLHPSALPKFRGGSPIQNQIINGISESMVSIIIMTKEVDAGPIVGQRKISLSGDMLEIFSQITEQGICITKDILSNGLCPVDQDHSLATTYKRREPKDSEISTEEIMTKSANYLHNKIRMLQDPYPNAFIRTADGKKLYLTASRLDD